MEGHGRKDKKKPRDSMSSDSKLPEPIWLRPFGLQTDTINRGLLDYNAYIICFCGPILYLILYFI